MRGHRPLVGVGTATVIRVVRHYEKTGSLEPLRAEGGNVSSLRKVESKLKAFVYAMPDATVVEMAAALERAGRWRRAGLRCSGRSPGS